MFVNILPACCKNHVGLQVPEEIAFASNYTFAVKINI